MPKPKSKLEESIARTMAEAEKASEKAPAVQQKAIPAAAATTENRFCCFRATSVDDSKISAITLASLQESGVRVTITDILRMALNRLPEKAITRDELKSLRAQYRSRVKR